MCPGIKPEMKDPLIYETGITPQIKLSREDTPIEDVIDLLLEEGVECQGMEQGTEFVCEGIESELVICVEMAEGMVTVEK